MVRNGLLALLVAGGATCSLSGQTTPCDSTISVDAKQVVNRITPLMYGSCIEDVNHEVYGGLYAQMVFGESFEEPPRISGAGLAGWTAYGGQWTPKEGAYFVAADQGAKVVRDDPEVSDGTVDCEVKFVDKEGDNAGLIVRVQDPRVGADAWLGYEVSLSARNDYVRLGRHRDDWSHFKDVRRAIEAGRWYRLRVVLTGPRLQVFIDGEQTPCIDHVDAQSPILSGRVGLRTWGSNVAFRELKITTVDKEWLDRFDRPAPPRPEDGVSGMWDVVRTVSAVARFSQDRERPFNTNLSQKIEFLSGKGSAGVANSGLNRWGMTFGNDHTYSGRVYLRGTSYRGRVTVALQSGDGKRTYAKQELGPIADDWSRHDFTLKSAQADTKGRLAIWIDKPGTVWVDQVYLSGTGEDLFRGLPIRADIANMLTSQGLTMLRYGGCMVNAPEYRWKKMIGDRDRRPQYRGFWYPHATNGFGVEDFVQFCQAAGFECVFAINIEETPQDAADLLEYFNGASTTTWGRRRAENGHPEPYGLRYIQIGNEEAISGKQAEYEHYLERFKILYEAMRPRDPKLQFVVAAWWKPAEPWIKRIVQELNGKASFWDVHVGGDDLREGDNVDRIFTEMRRLLQEWAPGTTLKACVLEENGGRHDLQRALGHAHVLNTTQRHGDFVVMDCPANCLQPWKQNDNGWDQGQVFFTSGQVWGMPPYYVQQMAAMNHLPLRVASEVRCPNNDLDVTVTRSEDGASLVIKVVNIGEEVHRAAIEMRGFESSGLQCDVWVLKSRPGDINTPEAPERIRWVHSTAPAVAERFEREFDAHSYTILRLSWR